MNLIFDYFALTCSIDFLSILNDHKVMLKMQITQVSKLKVVKLFVLSTATMQIWCRRALNPHIWGETSQYFAYKIKNEVIVKWLIFFYFNPVLNWVSLVFQDYLHIVDSLNIPTPDSQYLLDLIRHRHWGESVLIVDVWVSSARLLCKSIYFSLYLNLHTVKVRQSPALLLCGEVVLVFQRWRVSWKHPSGHSKLKNSEHHSSYWWVCLWTHIFIVGKRFHSPVKVTGVLHLWECQSPSPVDLFHNWDFDLSCSQTSFYFTFMPEWNRVRHI